VRDIHHSVVPFLTFDEWSPFRFESGAVDEDWLDIMQTLKSFISLLAPFADLIPLSVLPLWQKYESGESMQAESPFAQPVEDLRSTMRPIARDAGVSVVVFMRLDQLLRLAHYKRLITRTPKTGIDFFPVAIISPERLNIGDERPCGQDEASCDSGWYSDV
jgi:hypothetical protein